MSERLEKLRELQGQLAGLRAEKEKIGEKSAPKRARLRELLSERTEGDEIQTLTLEHILSLQEAVELLDRRVDQFEAMLTELTIAFVEASEGKGP